MSFWRKVRKVFNLDVPISPAARPREDPALVSPGAESKEVLSYVAWMEKQLEVKRDRLGKYGEYREMDEEEGDLPASILDTYRDDICQLDLQTKKIVWVDSANKDVTDILDRLFVAPLGLRSEFKKVVREMIKFGDCFEQLLVEPRKGVVGWKHVIPDLMNRIEDDWGRLRGFNVGMGESDGEVKKKGDGKELSLPWDYIHFRVSSKGRGALYGTSLLESGRRRWEELRMAEQAALLYRIRMAPDRDIYYVDCGTQSPVQQMQTVMRWRNQMKRRRMVDPSMLRYDVEYDPRNTSDDAFWPVTANKNSRIERLSGGGKMADMEDIRYWLTRFLSVENIPPGYYGLLDQGAGLNLNTSLAAQDIRYARVVKSVQEDALTGLMTICFVHLALRGLDPFQPENEFSLLMSPVSFLDEFHRQELYNIRVDITDRLFSLGERARLKERPWFKYVLLNFARIPPSVLAEVFDETEEAVEKDVAGFSESERQVVDKIIVDDPLVAARLYKFRIKQLLEDGVSLVSSEFNIGYAQKFMKELDVLMETAKSAAINEALEREA